jgi:DNA repair exonuclease SbcCD ATPase subunit
VRRASTPWPPSSRAARPVEAKLDRFEERLARWDQVDQDVARSLEELAKRQGTVGALHADLERMFAMAERTTESVREITSVHSQIEDSRELLEQVMARLQELRNTASSLDERKRQLAKAEERLARAEGLLVDVGSSLESLNSQKAIVDQAVEKAGSLQYLLKQAEAVIEGLREERKTNSLVRPATGAVGEEDMDDDDMVEGDEEVARAA